MIEGGGKLNIIPNEAYLGIAVPASTIDEQKRIDLFLNS